MPAGCWFAAEHQRRWGRIFMKKVLISHEKNRVILNQLPPLSLQEGAGESINHLKVDCSEHLDSHNFFWLLGRKNPLNCLLFFCRSRQIFLCFFPPSLLLFMSCHKSRKTSRKQSKTKQEIAERAWQWALPQGHQFKPIRSQQHLKYLRFNGCLTTSVKCGACWFLTLSQQGSLCREFGKCSCWVGDALGQWWGMCYGEWVRKVSIPQKMHEKHCSEGWSRARLTPGEEEFVEREVRN